jgi:hypothetical protein
VKYPPALVAELYHPPPLRIRAHPLDRFILLAHCTKTCKMLIKSTIGLAIGLAALVHGSACPYSDANSRSERVPHLEPRFHTGSDFGKCPSKRLSKYAGGGSRSQDWWPCELSLAVLRQNGKESNPLSADFIYANEFAKLDCKLRHSRQLFGC